MRGAGEKTEFSHTKCRFYCNNNEECSQAEKALVAAKIPFVKLESNTPNAPMLIAIQQTCIGLADILRFTDTVSKLRKEYDVDWY